MYHKRLVFWAACLGILFFGMGIITLGSVKQAIGLKYGMDDIAAGTLFSILPFGILLGSLLFGPASDKYGYKVILSLCCFSMFLGFEGIAYAPSTLLLKIGVFLFGLGGGAINGATSALVSDISEEKKGANLSILGVFFGLGALGMPFLLGVLEHNFNYDVIVAMVGWLTLVVGAGYLWIKFPAPKQTAGFPIKEGLALVKDGALLLIAFFLFCQSSFEAIINNWTTTYLIGHKALPPDKALYALSLFVVGMTFMRLLLGSILRNLKTTRLWLIAFVLLGAGLGLLMLCQSFAGLIAGLILMGAGLAGGFPLMLGLVGDRYKTLSGTAFGLVLVIALAGNMLINYGTGIIVQHYGIRYLTAIATLEWAVMIILCVAIFKQLKNQQ